MTRKHVYYQEKLSNIYELYQYLENGCILLKIIIIREQILHYSHEQRHVLGYKLGQTRIEHCLQQDSRIVDVRVSRAIASHLARDLEYRLDGAQSEIVVVLLGELSGGELVELHHFAAEFAG